MQPFPVMEIEQEVDGRWIAEIPSIPGALAYGETEDEAREKAWGIAMGVKQKWRGKDEIVD